jgi:hypothetical protein
MPHALKPSTSLEASQARGVAPLTTLHPYEKKRPHNKKGSMGIPILAASALLRSPQSHLADLLHTPNL